MKKYIHGLLILMVVYLLNVIHVYAEEEPKPTKNQLIIVNKSINKLAFYEDGELMKIYKVATGRTKSLTPEGDFEVIVKWKCPVYYKTNTPGCAWNNPLGNRWIGLSVPGTVGYTYGIHGNNAEWSIGTNASSGCVRMYDWEVEALFEVVEEGAKVKILNSNQTFDEIARNMGYPITDDKAEISDAYIVIGKEVNTYERASKYYKVNGVVAPATIQVTKKYKDWYYVTTETASGWVKDGSIDEIDTIKEIVRFRVNGLLERKGFSFHVKEMIQTIELPFFQFNKKA